MCEVYLVPVVRWLLLLWWSGGSTFCPDAFPSLWREWVSQGSFWASINKQINMFPSHSLCKQTCLESSGISVLHILPHLPESVFPLRVIGNPKCILKNRAAILVSGHRGFGQQQLWDNWMSQLSNATLFYAPHTKACAHRAPLPSSLCWSENRANKRVCVHGNGVVSIFSVGESHWVSPEFEVGGSVSLIIIITQKLWTHSYQFKSKIYNVFRAVLSSWHFISLSCILRFTTVHLTI